jgi:hypothetical protein
MKKVYFIVRDGGTLHEMYHSWGNGAAGKHWTSKISEANHWPTDDRPKLMIVNEGSYVSVIAMTKVDYFKRVLQGK